MINLIYGIYLLALAAICQVVVIVLFLSHAWRRLWDDCMWVGVVLLLFSIVMYFIAKNEIRIYENEKDHD